jgi:uncharacterized protein (UPF0335 family)
MSDIAEIADSGVSEAQLKAYVERIESVQEQIDEFTTERKDIFAEAKSAGFDKKILAAVIRRRKLERAERQEMDALLELYEEALAKVA